MRVRDKLDVTSVVVTHDMRSARRVGQRILMLHEKKIYAQGTSEEIFSSQDPIVRQFIDGISHPKEDQFLKQRRIIMSKSRLEGKVGLFVFIGLALLAALLIQFSKGTTFFRHTYNILLRAPSVGGLKARAGVLMSGVQVGTVSDIKLGPQGTNVTLTLKIYGQYEIHKDAMFLIEQSGFLGDQ